VLVLVTGASGAVGAELAPRLAAAGHRVRAFARDPARVTAAGVAEVVRGDVVSGAGLDAALAGVEVAYFLVHSMETALGAEGGLVPADGAMSPHLASRLEVERTLLDAAPEAVALRASIVIGARSRSFRLLVRLVERVPVMLLPSWRAHRTQPIDVRDVLAFLAAVADSPAVRGPLSLDIAGPDRLSYAAMMERIRDALALGRPRLDLPFALNAVASRVAAAIAGEDPALVGPLMGSLEHDLLPRDDRAGGLLGVRLHRFDAAVEHALGEWEASEQLAGR
jgi:uncharacterized protein YbjT (DUF2867 family)